MSDPNPVRVAFDKFDADGSGKLEKGELMSVLEELGLDVSDGDFVSYASALMEDYDADENGELDFAEFTKMYDQCLASEETRKAYAEELRFAVEGLVGNAMSAIIENDAATKIQAMHRGKLARREIREQKDQTTAAVKIQAVHREKQARKELTKQNEEPDEPSETDEEAVESLVAELVETSVTLEEGDEADEADVDLDEQAAAAVKIQAMHRGKQARGEMQEQKEQTLAVLKIQAVHRGKQARKEVQEMREHTAAAVKIQAVHRGKQACKELQMQKQDPDMRPDTSVSQDEPSSTSDAVRVAFDKFDVDGSGKLECGELMQVLEELDLDVTNSDFVSYAEALMEDYDADANGELDYSEFQKLYAQCLVSEETRTAYAEELSAAVGGLVGGAMTVIIENDAAAKIQAVHRGKQARKELAEQFTAAPRATETPDARPAESDPVSEPSAADPARVAFDKFDADGSGKLEKGELMSVLEELGLDVSDGDFVSYASALMEDYDADENGELDFAEFTKMYDQCLASEETRKAYAEELRFAVEGLVGNAMSAIIENDAATKIQAMHRGKLARREIREQKDQTTAAVKIQAVHREKQARKELTKQNEEPDEPSETDEEAVESLVAELVETSVTLEEGDEADEADVDLDEQAAAAVKIQAMHRGKQARGEMQEQKEQTAAAVKIQAVHRGKQACKELEEQKEQTAAAVKIQAMHRGKQARKELEEQKEQTAAAVKIQAMHRGKQARKELEEQKEQTAAVLKIQAVHRGKQTRMELRREREEQAELAAAALKIQAVHRGEQTRMELRKQREEEQEQAAAALKIQAVHRGKQTRMELRKERERVAKLGTNKVAPAPIGQTDPDVYSEDENYDANVSAVKAASGLISKNPKLADALEAAAVVSNRPSYASPNENTPRGTHNTSGGLSRHMVHDLAKRLPSLCGGGKGGEMEALKLIAAVVATRRRTNKVAPM